jgi:hypothetical protein
MSTQSTRSFAAVQLERQPALRDEAVGSSIFDILKNHPQRKQVTIDGEQFYIIEGDLMLDEDQLAIYSLQQETLKKARLLGISTMTEQPQSDALVGIVQNGKLVRWKEGLVLTYCVLKGTLFSQERYQLVCDSMKKATEDWQKTCGVHFEHKAELDESPGTENPGVLFTVRGIDAGGQFIAAAFFPNDPANRRRVLIDPSYFDQDLGFDKAGVLRHELGHVLGFRHEHIRSGAPAACPDEPLFGTSELTQYDPRSVMHYFCGGVGSRELAMTELDRIGSQKLYGPPFDMFFFVG